MKNIFLKSILLMILTTATCLSSNAQIDPSTPPEKIAAPKGTLFIIGGGDRDDSLMQRMLKEAGWKKGDEIVIMTLSSIYSDSTYIWSNDQLSRLTGYAAVKFDSASVHNEKKLDSLRKAKIIFICGGDQSRFMSLIHNSDVKKIIRDAYFNGTLVGGTSAGAAVMSEKMITGNQLLDTAYESTFDRIRSENLELQEGLGLLDSVIIDMHFVKRSRFNRLFTATLEYPEYQCIGIDESTALVVHGEKATVSGVSQVIVFGKSDAITHGNNHLIGGDFSVSVYLPNESFTVKR